jgi:hypothetical protein
MNILSILVLLLLGLQCVFSIPRVKETMLSLAQSDVNKKWNSFKLKHTRSFTNKSEETRR